jgi:hypothetical protein
MAALFQSEVAVSRDQDQRLNTEPTACEDPLAANDQTVSSSVAIERVYRHHGSL